MNWLAFVLLCSFVLASAAECLGDGAFGLPYRVAHEPAAMAPQMDMAGRAVLLNVRYNATECNASIAPANATEEFTLKWDDGPKQTVWVWVVRNKEPCAGPRVHPVARQLRVPLPGTFEVGDPTLFAFPPHHHFKAYLLWPTPPAPSPEPEDLTLMHIDDPDGEEESM